MSLFNNTKVWTIHKMIVYNKVNQINFSVYEISLNLPFPKGEF